MDLIACRDCGEMLPADAEGCKRCGRNITLEQRLSRILFWTVSVSIVLAAALVAWLLAARQGAG